MASETIPNDAEIREKILIILQTVDIETMGIKSFIQLLSKEMNVSHTVLKANKKDYIKQILTDAINEGNHRKVNDAAADDDDDDGGGQQDAKENHDENEDEDSDGDEEEEDGKPSNGRGLTQKKLISEALATFFSKTIVKQENESNTDTTTTNNNNNDNNTVMMARTEVVKELWNYIRKYNLQNPDNKREIVLDTAMQAVFGCTTFTIFTMNKYIGAHIDPFKPVDLTPKYKERNSTSSGSTGKRLRSRGGSPKGTGSAIKKPRKVGTQPPYMLSEAMQAVVGTDILPRPQVVSKIWTYIKDHDLQNPNDKREILCDDKLKLLFDNKNKISMFKMNVYIGKHLIEKVDRSQYHHQQPDDTGNDNEDNDDDDDP